MVLSVGRLLCIWHLTQDGESHGGKIREWLTAAELKLVVKVEVKEPLLRLFEKKQLHREKMTGVYVYFSNETIGRRKQVMLRKDRGSETTAGLENLKGELLAHELKAAVGHL